mmetsp:Transcript_4584/g.11439  ORF Transcript_4584/g.11439 Transcript_4584/m.11439 type:complete len:322 (+) Transcript_4584:915-1880(+)
MTSAAPRGEEARRRRLPLPPRRGRGANGSGSRLDRDLRRRAGLAHVDHQVARARAVLILALPRLGRDDRDDLADGAGNVPLAPAGVRRAPLVAAGAERLGVEEVRVAADGAARVPRVGAALRAVGAERVGADELDRALHRAEADGARRPRAALPRQVLLAPRERGDGALQQRRRVDPRLGEELARVRAVLGRVAQRHDEPAAAGGAHGARREHGERADGVVGVREELEGGRGEADVARGLGARVGGAEGGERGERHGVDAGAAEQLDPLGGGAAGEGGGEVRRHRLLGVGAAARGEHRGVGGGGEGGVGGGEAEERVLRRG